jgi:CHASE3 domain sensor protein
MMDDYFLILIALLVASVGASVWNNRKLAAQRQRQNDLLERIAKALEARDK